MAGLRAMLRKYPLAVKTYRTARDVAYRLFSTDSRQIADGETCGSPDGAPLGPSLVSDSRENEPKQAAPSPGEAAAVLAPTPADFDIYHQYPPHVFYTFRDQDAIFREAVAVYSNVPVEEEPSGLHTDPNRVLQFYQLISAANRLRLGDYAEFGCHRGFSTRVIHRFMDPSFKLYAFDTFGGFDERDISVEKSLYDSPWGAGSFAPTSVERVARYVGDGEWPANLKLIKGWLPGSYKGMEDCRWRFVHVDLDLYAPIKAVLDRVWEQVVPGGIVLVHDYGCYGFPGARKAVDDFCDSVGIAPIELIDRWSSAVIRKNVR
ncbi:MULTISPECIES: class I SAM-dependent methyltransferase [unclassified Bradyrhizobium]|uniref:class I SAM-dependent methyltransferase n=1 Tax=unclassified Bradyrhizobium TaxID=2631580 RepID=UPI0028EFD3BF|nr:MULTISPECIES: class I SAM-dependent methyltransferase [unclassified Bradyrhizobium]